MCADLPNNETESFLELKFKAFAFKWIFKVEKDYSWKSHNMSLSGSFSDGKEKSNIAILAVSFLFLLTVIVI